jgi:hypothetical protein
VIAGTETAQFSVLQVLFSKASIATQKSACELVSWPRAGYNEGP